MSDGAILTTPAGRPLQLPQTVEFLYDHGPSTLAELPSHGLSIEDRICDVRRFYVRTSHRGAEKTAGHVKGVYYILGVHDERDVVAAFLRANPQLADRPTESLVRLFERDGGVSEAVAREAVEGYEAGPDSSSSSRTRSSHRRARRQ